MQYVLYRKNGDWHAVAYNQNSDRNIVLAFMAEFPKEKPVALFDSLGRLLWTDRPANEHPALRAAFARLT